MHLQPGVPYTPKAEGVYMSMDRYRRYRRAVADRILEAAP